MGSNRIAKELIIRQICFVERFEVEIHEPLFLPIGDPEVTMDVNDVLESEFTSESVGATEGFRREPSEMVDVCWHSLCEKLAKNGISENVVVEDLFDAMQCAISTCMLVNSLHQLLHGGPGTDPRLSVSPDVECAPIPRSGIRMQQGLGPAETTVCRRGARGSERDTRRVVSSLLADLVLGDTYFGRRPNSRTAVSPSSWPA